MSLLSTDPTNSAGSRATPPRTGILGMSSEPAAEGVECISAFPGEVAQGLEGYVQRRDIRKVADLDLGFAQAPRRRPIRDFEPGLVPFDLQPVAVLLLVPKSKERANSSRQR